MNQWTLYTVSLEWILFLLSELTSLMPSRIENFYLSKHKRIPILFKRVYLPPIGSSLMAQIVKNLPAMRETWVQSPGWEDPLEREWLPTPVFLPGEFHGQRSQATVHGVAKSRSRLTINRINEVSRKTHDQVETSSAAIPRH